jgi:hypothetical protein
MARRAGCAPVPGAWAERQTRAVGQGRYGCERPSPYATVEGRAQALPAMSGPGLCRQWTHHRKRAMVMNTAKQAAENMAYVRRLLKEKQAGFSAAVELAVSLIDRRIEWPEGNDGTDAAARTPRDHRGARPRAGVARRSYSGGALRGSHSASSADIGRRLTMEVETVRLVRPDAVGERPGVAGGPGNRPGNLRARWTAPERDGET